MKIQQYYLACLSHASYMIMDDVTKTAAVVDPQRDIGQYRADAAAGGYAIRPVFLTHFHADFVAGHIELRDRAGATIHLGHRAEVEFACAKMKDETASSSATCGSRSSRPPATRPKASPSWSTTSPRAARTRSPCSPGTRCSSATSAGPAVRA